MVWLEKEYHANTMIILPSFYKMIKKQAKSSIHIGLLDYNWTS